MTNYGPDNPHPLSQMTTELIWEGKYDEFGHRREVNVAGLAMPLQRIECRFPASGSRTRLHTFTRPR